MGETEFKASSPRQHQASTDMLSYMSAVQCSCTVRLHANTHYVNGVFFFSPTRHRSSHWDQWWADFSTGATTTASDPWLRGRSRSRWMKIQIIAISMVFGNWQTKTTQRFKVFLLRTPGVPLSADYHSGVSHQEFTSTGFCFITINSPKASTLPPPHCVGPLLLLATKTAHHLHL